MTFRGGGSGKPLAGQEVPRSAVSISRRKLPPAQSLDVELVLAVLHKEIYYLYYSLLRTGHSIQQSCRICI